MATNEGPKEKRRGYTTVTIDVGLHERLADLKPYDSMSYGELLSEMADEYEKEVTY